VDHRTVDTTVDSLMTFTTEGEADLCCLKLGKLALQRKTLAEL
jgi:hypothetical protein